jgi:uncharacterized Zn-finger protein
MTDIKDIAKTLLFVHGMDEVESSEVEEIDEVEEPLETAVNTAASSVQENIEAIRNVSELMRKQELPTKSETKDQKPNKKYKCTECDKSFTQQAHLQIHFRKHTGERPFHCSFPNCFKSFTQLGNLKTHERKHTGLFD